MAVIFRLEGTVQASVIIILNLLCTSLAGLFLPRLSLSNSDSVDLSLKDHSNRRDYIPDSPILNVSIGEPTCHQPATGPGVTCAHMDPSVNSLASFS